jgi:hypothetical protein
MMIFAAICIVAGIIVFIFFDEIKHSRNKLILYWCTHTLGRYGFPGSLIGAGLIIGLKGYFQYKGDKEENNSI